MKLRFNHSFYKSITFYLDILLIIVWVQSLLTTNICIEQIICALFIIISTIDAFTVTIKDN